MSELDNTTVTPMETEIDSKPDQMRTNALSINMKPQKQSSYSDAFLNLYKCCIGSGILAAPYTFYMGGYLMTSICYFIIGILMVYSQLMLLKIVDEIDRPNMGFTEITRLILGEKYVIMNRLFIIIMQWGCCASYVLFFMEFFEFAIYHSTNMSFEHELVYLGFAMCIVLPLIFINNMAVFAKFSAISNSLIVTALIACVAYYIIELVEEINYDDIPIANWRNLPIVLGVAMYSFEAVGVLLNIRISMESPSRFPKLMTLVFTIGTIQNWMFGLLGSLSYGIYTNQIVLFSLGKGAQIFQIMYAFALVISLPLMLLPAFQLIERVTVFKNFIQYGTSGYLIRRTSIRFLQVIAIAGLAIGIPEFAVLISFIGGLAGSVLQFFFPMMFYLRWDWKDHPSKNQGIMFIFAMCFGCFLGSVAVVDSIYQIVMLQD